MSSNLPISARVRPNSEAAPWVIDEIRDLEARTDRLEDALRTLLPLLARDEDRAVTGIFGGDTLDAIDAARAAIEASANSRNEEESMACKSDDDLSDEALWAGIAAGMITPAHIAQPTVAEQDQINAEAAIRSIYGTPSVPLPNDLLLIAGVARSALLRRNGGVVTDAQREAHGAIVVALTRLYLAEKGYEDPKDANIALLVTCMARSEQLARVLREVIEAIEFTPLGVRAIKALEDARAALEGAK